MKKEFVFRFVLALGIFFLVFQFAIRPLLDNKSGNRRDNGAKGIFAAADGYDVIVMGDQPDGIAAAVAAARLGAKTLLLSQGKDLGGSISQSLITDLEISYGADNKPLNAGYLAELDNMLGRQFSPQDYISAVNTLVKKEKNIEVKYNVSLESPVIKGHTLEGLNIRVGEMPTAVEGKMFVDATAGGDLLLACKIPYITGSEDLNIKNSFLPVRLNFLMKGPDMAKVQEMIKSSGNSIYKTLGEYSPIDVHTRVGNFGIFAINTDAIIVHGLEFSGINVTDPRELANEYSMAVKEARSFALFLAGRFEQLRGWKYQDAAGQFDIRERLHFEGLYKLNVNDVLDNARFDRTVAMGSYPVQVGKFTGGSGIIAGKPVQYGIPLGSLVPAEVDNLLMTGAKSSYSSLAASSAGTIGTGIVTGSAAGVVAVYSLLNNLDPGDIVREKDPEKIGEFRKFLQGQSLNFPDKDIKSKNASNWAYTALRELLALGLVAGGTGNNYSFDRKAVQGDLAILLLNGIYRSDSKKYTLDLDTRIRPYFNKEPLTKEKAAEILEALYDLPDKGKGSYEKVSKLGYINNILQLSLKDKQVLTMDDVYYLAAQNIKLFTQ